jgi:hypothetical protein
MAALRFNPGESAPFDIRKEHYKSFRRRDAENAEKKEF